MGISWSKMWNTVKIACTVIVATGVIFSIWTHLIRPTAKLSAVVKYSPVYWPPPFVKATDKFNELIEIDNIRKVFIDPNLNREDLNTSIAFREYLKEGLSEFRGSLRNHSDFFHIQVTNNGKRICNGVSVKLPRNCLVEVIREDNTREILENVSVVTIGDLNPTEGVLLDVWSHYLSEHSMEDIKITHDLGIASIDIRKTVGYFGRWVDKYSFWLVMASLPVLGGIFGFIGWYLEQEIEEKPQEFDKELQRPKKVEGLTSSSVKDKTK